MVFIRFDPVTGSFGRTAGTVPVDASRLSQKPKSEGIPCRDSSNRSNRVMIIRMPDTVL
jgi:hypothetical protein